MPQCSRYACRRNGVDTQWYLAIIPLRIERCRKQTVSLEKTVVDIQDYVALRIMR